MMRLVGFLVPYVVLYFAWPYLLIFALGVTFLPILLLVWAFVLYGEWKKSKLRSRAQIANARSPGSYCEECLCQLAGNPKEYPHQYSCSHSTEILKFELREDVVRSLDNYKQ